MEAPEWSKASLKKWRMNKICFFSSCTVSVWLQKSTLPSDSPPWAQSIATVAFFGRSCWRPGLRGWSDWSGRSGWRLCVVQSKHIERFSSLLYVYITCPSSYYKKNVFLFSLSLRLMHSTLLLSYRSPSPAMFPQDGSSVSVWSLWCLFHQDIEIVQNVYMSTFHMCFLLVFASSMVLHHCAWSKLDRAPLKLTMRLSFRLKPRHVLKLKNNTKWFSFAVVSCSIRFFWCLLFALPWWNGIGWEIAKTLLGPRKWVPEQNATMQVKNKNSSVLFVEFLQIEPSLSSLLDLGDACSDLEPQITWVSWINFVFKIKKNQE